MKKARQAVAFIGISVLTPAILYAGAYFIRGTFHREHLVCHREFKTQSEMNLFAPLWRIEDYLREMRGEEFVPGFENSN
jgi:hypothetical protein